MGLAAIDVAVAAGLAVVLDKALLTLRDPRSHSHPRRVLDGAWRPLKGLLPLHQLGVTSSTRSLGGLRRVSGRFQGAQRRP